MSANTLPTTPAAPVLTGLPPSLPAEAPRLSLPWPPSGEHLVLSAISWKQYVAIADALEERHIRVTYDRGTMEIMTLSLQHERLIGLARRFIDVITEEMNIDIFAGGMTTFRREDLDRGFEPDACYWIAHHAQMRGRRQVNLSVDPPPDLALEAEVSRTVVNRLTIYAAVGVPEVWRYDGQTLRVLLRGEDGEYHENPRSRSFPFLPVAELLRFAALSETTSDTKVVQMFRQWVREQMAVNWGQSASEAQGS